MGAWETVCPEAQFGGYTKNGALRNTCLPTRTIVTALVDGSSVDTTMGLTPTRGVAMGTRPGDLDPGLVLYLLRQQEAAKEESIADVEAILNQRSGMVALSGMPNNVKAVRQAAF